MKRKKKLGLIIYFYLLNMFQKKGLTREELLAQAEQKRKELENKKNLSKYQVFYQLFLFFNR